MMRTHYIIIALFAFLFAACEKNENLVNIKGEFENINQAEFYIFCDGASFSGIDTIKIEDGKFEYEFEMKEKDILHLLYPNFSETHIIGEPGANIIIKGSASNLGLVEVGGTEENNLLTAFRQANAKRSPQEKAMAVAEFIRSHPNTLAAIAVWKRSFARIEHPGIEALQLLSILLEAQPHNATLRQLNEQTHALVSTIEGTYLPEFKAATIKGDSISNADFAGKPLVIAFWANWQSESGTFARELVKYKKEHPNKINLLHVSLDATTTAAKRTLSNDSTETLVCDSLMFDSPLVQRFGIRFVPSAIIVDKDGKIVTRDLPIKKLQEKLSEL